MNLNLTTATIHIVRSKMRSSDSRHALVKGNIYRYVHSTFMFEIRYMKFDGILDLGLVVPYLFDGIPRNYLK